MTSSDILLTGSLGSMCAFAGQVASTKSLAPFQKLDREDVLWL
jgi:hypothetical protein